MKKQGPPVRKWQIAAMGAVGVLVAIIVTVGAINENTSPGTPTAGTSPSPLAPGPVTTSGAEPETADPRPEKALTAQSNKDLAALLAAVDDHGLYEKFASSYEGRTIKFDGIIAAMNQHGEATTRYDILIFAGESTGAGVTGPNFQFRDVNLTNDLNLTGANIPDTLDVGQKLRISAKVERYIETSDLFLLDPVATTVRP
ncbi:DUF4839 domain-containing protein [Micromonospora sp. WMMA1923]|uniref:DUF4839 domain-containing protein n=1 Tax=Micromonospora sp. WMMA1923 TaxID=3404125 RepID=UPI003B92F776